MGISQELYQDILAHADIVHVISSYGLNLIKKGNSYVALCPFHPDKHPSMQVNPQKRIFKCFSCGTGGNAISFVQKYEHISPEEAARKVAELCGYDDPRLSHLLNETPKEDEETLALRSTIEDLGNYYLHSLNTQEAFDAVAYLDSRGLTRDVREQFLIGYAPLDGEKTIQYLEALGHSIHAINGIGITGNLGSLRDLNAGRIIFFIHDKEGRLVGFNARRFRNEEGGKYINSPETKIFHKSEILYNFFRAKEFARREGYLYLLEGPMDVIAFHKAGISSAVALMGTNLSDAHIKAIRHLGAEIRFCLDGDEAGQKGMMNAISSLQKAGINVRFVHNPNDLRDPDDIFKDEGAEGLRKWANHLVNAMDFQLSFFREFGGLNTEEKKEKAVRYFLPRLKALPEGIAREDAIVRLAQATGFEASAIRQTLLDTKTPVKKEEIKISSSLSKKKTRQEISMLPPREKKLANIEREILTYMVKNREALDWAQRSLRSLVVPIYQDLANYILDYAMKSKNPVDVALLTNDIEVGESAKGHSLEAQNKMISLLYELDEDYSYPPYSEKEITLLQDKHEKARRRLSEEERVRKIVRSSSAMQGASELQKYASEKREEWEKAKKASVED